MTNKVTVKENKPVQTGKITTQGTPIPRNLVAPCVAVSLQSIYISLETSGNKADNVP